MNLSRSNQNSYRMATVELAPASALELFDGVAQAVAIHFPEVEPRRLARSLAAREAECETIVAQGLAFPHAAVEGLSEPVIIRLSLPEPIPWCPGTWVDACVVILTPRDQRSVHLELLAEAARPFVAPCAIETTKVS